MREVSIIGLDLAKNVFQAHGASADGSVVFRRKLSRSQLLKFMAAQPPCVVAMEAGFVAKILDLPISVLLVYVVCPPRAAKARAG